MTSEALTTNIASIIALVKSIMTLFGEFPLNLILASMLGGIGFTWFRKAKKAVK